MSDENEAAAIVTRSMLGIITAQSTVISLLIGALEDNGTLVPGAVLERLGMSLAAMEKALAAAGMSDDPMQKALVTFTGATYRCLSDFDLARRGGKLSG